MLSVRLHGERLEQYDGDGVVEHTFAKHDHVEGGAEVHAAEDGQSGNGVNAGNQGSKGKRVARRQRGREARQAGVVDDDADGQAGHDGTEHSESQNTADEGEEFSFVKAVAGVEYNRRQEVNEKSLGVKMSLTNASDCQ